MVNCRVNIKCDLIFGLIFSPSKQQQQQQAFSYLTELLIFRHIIKGIYQVICH